jgi:hypothetical protein
MDDISRKQLNTMNPAAKKAVLGDRIHALESIVATDSDGGLLTLGKDGSNVPIVIKLLPAGTVDGAVSSAGTGSLGINPSTGQVFVTRAAKWEIITS